MRTNRQPPSPCPVCGKVLDANTPATDDAHEAQIPSPGDVSLCGYCGAVCTFALDLTLRRPTAEEMESFLADPAVREMVRRLNVYLAWGN